MAWYRNEFTMLPSEFDKKILLAFGAVVDEACTVWVNGRLVLDRPYPYQGDAESWKALMWILRNLLILDRVNSVVIRIRQFRCRRDLAAGEIDSVGKIEKGLCWNAYAD